MVCIAITGVGYAVPEGENLLGERPQLTEETFFSGMPKEEGGRWSDFLNVRFVGNWSFGHSYAVAYDASRNPAFCGSGGGVYILDVSTTSAPVKISEDIHTRDFVYGGLFYDSPSQRLYIADGTPRLEIWDVSMPDSPVKLGYYDTLYYVYGVYVSGSYAYVAAGSDGLRIIDVSNPPNPYEVGYY